MRAIMATNVTVDTTAWVDWLDKKGSYIYVDRMVDWHDQGLIRLFGVTRIQLDTFLMDSSQKEELERLFRIHKIELSSSPFRIGISTLGGPDTLSGSMTKIRSNDEVIAFCRLIKEPTTLHPSQVGNKIGNKIGDYDALRDHFKNGRDFFVTCDTKDYFQPKYRQTLKNELGVTILSPEEFVNLQQPLLLSLQ